MHHHLLRLPMMQQALRANVCTQCWQRPAGSESLPATQASSCEGGCPIFIHLPKLAGIAAAERGDERGPYEEAVRSLICSNCTLSPTAGDFCLEGLTRSCALSRYADRVVTVL